VETLGKKGWLALERLARGIRRAWGVMGELGGRNPMGHSPARMQETPTPRGRSALTLVEKRDGGITMGKPPHIGGKRGTLYRVF